MKRYLMAAAISLAAALTGCVTAQTAMPEEITADQPVEMPEAVQETSVRVGICFWSS